jgi:hypothetical protein
MNLKPPQARLGDPVDDLDDDRIGDRIDRIGDRIDRIGDQSQE